MQALSRLGRRQIRGRATGERGQEQRRAWARPGRTRAWALVVAFGLWFVALGAVPASGHSPAKWYAARWKAPVVSWRFDDDFPRGGGIRRAVVNGSLQWNRAGASFRFRHRGSEQEAGSVDPCKLPRSRNFVDWKSIDGPGGKLAETIVCSFGDGTGPNQIHSFHMVFDSAEPWHTDPSSLPLPFAVDLWAVAAHEFGHATGRISGGPRGDGHFAERSRLCPDIADPGRHTMCPSYDIMGVWMRTLEPHDIDAFKRAYRT